MVVIIWDIAMLGLPSRLTSHLSHLEQLLLLLLGSLLVRELETILCAETARGNVVI